jgi:hypothetical protein
MEEDLERARRDVMRDYWEHEMQHWGFIIWSGLIVGFAVGCVVSYLFIFPANILNLKLADLTIGDLLRIFGGLGCIGLASSLGLRIGHRVDGRIWLA